MYNILAKTQSLLYFKKGKINHVVHAFECDTTTKQTLLVKNVFFIWSVDIMATSKQCYICGVATEIYVLSVTVYTVKSI